MTASALNHARQVAAASRRRQEIAAWLERFEAIQAIRPRSDEERIAQHQALALLERARPATPA